MPQTTFNGRRLREARTLKGLGLREAAGLAGVDPAYLSRIERGLQVPSMGVVYRLAEVLEIRPVKDAIDLIFEFSARGSHEPRGAR